MASARWWNGHQKLWGRPAMQRLIPKFKRLLSIPYALREVRVGQQPFVHSPQFLPLPLPLMLNRICGPVRGVLRCPSDLTIVLVHNYSEMPLTEKSLRYVGIDNYVVLRPPVAKVFLNTHKLMALVRWLGSGACTTEYVLYLDAKDVFVRANPLAAIHLLQGLGCDLLFSSEQESYLYECMPAIKAWTDGLADKMEVPRRYLNAGVFVGRKTFLLEVLKNALKYAAEDDLSHGKLVAGIRSGSLRDRLPEFPFGCGSDQAILRYLHPRFFPRMQVDYECRLAWRNLPEGGGL
ncbi:MAG: hypothetical protein ACOYMT_04835 [Chthoniobacterales bacterium]